MQELLYGCDLKLEIHVLTYFPFFDIALIWYHEYEVDTTSGRFTIHRGQVNHGQNLYLCTYQPKEYCHFALIEDLHVMLSVLQKP
jgi:hypothetical protein